MTRDRHPGTRRVVSLALLSVAVPVLMAGCANGSSQSDRQALEEFKRCPPDIAMETVEPPPGDYTDHGIILDYDKLAPRRGPAKNMDFGYSRAVISSPDQLEQVYYDATHGNARASWFLCQFEVGVRQFGRDAARYLARVDCQTFVNCDLDFEKLPFSRQTASGQRVYEEAGRAFQAEATRIKINQDIISQALSLYVGARIAARIARVPRTPPPSFKTYPKSSVWSKPPAARGLAIEKRLGKNTPDNFKTIDRWKAGTATSIKSIDLRAATYQNPKKLISKIKKYINEVVKFNGGVLGSRRILPTNIKGRALEIAVPEVGTAAQQGALKQMVDYGKSVGVSVDIVIIK